MSLTIYILIAGVIAGWIITYLDFSDSDWKDPKKRRALWVKIFIPTIIMALAIGQEVNDTNIKDAKAKIMKAENDSIKADAITYRSRLSESDSIYNIKLQIRIDCTNARNIRETNVALAKYHLEYVDSLNSIVPKISVTGFKRPILFIPNFDPNTNVEFPIFKDSIPGVYSLEHRMFSSDNTSFNIKLYYKIFSCEFNRTNTGFAVFNEKAIQSKKIFMDTESFTEGAIAKIDIELEPRALKLPHFIVMIFGTYSDKVTGGITYQIKHGYLFDMKTKSLLFAQINKAAIENMERRNLLK